MHRFMVALGLIGCAGAEDPEAVDPSPDESLCLLVRAEAGVQFPGGELEMDTVWEYTYDDAYGLVQLVQLSQDEVTGTWIYEPGPHGPLRRESTRNERLLDVYVWTYDDEGHVVERLADLDGDGTWDERSTATYEDGLLQEQRRDDGDDGTDDVVWLYTYVDGLRDEVTVDVGLDGVIDERARYTYDAQGREVLRETDQGDDGIFERRVQNLWRDDLLTRTWTELFGVQESQEDYTYDGLGNLVRTDRDPFGDGLITEVRTQTWECGISGP